MVEKRNGSCRRFLKKCKESSDAAYSALRSVLEKLENPSSRVDARRFLTNLQKNLDFSGISSDDCFSTYHFRINDIQLEHSSYP
ncbi:Methionine S-methyltransferase, partial [Bienertia sinuspersici]